MPVAEGSSGVQWGPPLGLYIRRNQGFSLNPYSAESDVYRRQILTSEVDPLTEHIWWFQT